MRIQVKCSSEAIDAMFAVRTWADSIDNEEVLQCHEYDHRRTHTRTHAYTSMRDILASRHILAHLVNSSRFAALHAVIAFRGIVSHRSLVAALSWWLLNVRLNCPEEFYWRVSLDDIISTQICKAMEWQMVKQWSYHLDNCCFRFSTRLHLTTR